MHRLAIVSIALAACGDNLADDLTSGPDAAALPAAGYDDPAIQAVLALPSAPLRYEPTDLPPHYTTPDAIARINTPADDPITDEGATLGRVLFYDVALSTNQAIACASCHHQSAAFADTEAHSHGFADGLTARNSMSLMDVRYYAPGRMFWDERVPTLEHQVLRPIQDAVEMGMDLDDLVERLRGQAYYPPLFALAFGDPSITSERISRALSQFVRSIIASHTRYDAALVAAGGNVMTSFPSYSAEENLGKALFFRPPDQPGKSARCAGCHVAPGQPQPAVFFMDRARNNGLHVDTTGDEGAGNGTFKSPSLRNVALSAPYMHDGSLPSLRAVVEHYNSGVEPHPNLDPRLRDPQGNPLRLGLTSDEIDALVAFLETLTDPTIASDARFADPFR
jgi:cytochrome c peroxidase